MAKSTIRHVKAKSAWKTVEIPKQFQDDELFHGLVDLQELTDYELVGENSTEISPQKGKRQKKRDFDDLEPFSSSAPAKKRKMDLVPGRNQLVKTKKSMRKTDLVIDDNVNATSKANVTNIVSDSDFSWANENKILAKEPELQNVRKRKKKKKKSHAASQTIKPDSVSFKMGNDDQGKINHATHSIDTDMSLWKNLFVPDELLRSLQEQGFANPTQIQALSLPSAIRDRKDILGAAETGSGKTLAFGIPVIAQILSLQKKMQKEKKDMEENTEEPNDESVTISEKTSEQNGPIALILEPTRELAIQVQKHLIHLASHTKIKFATIVGGMSVEKQQRVLKRAPEVVIATPGRLWQLIEEGDEHLNQVDCVHSLVVDEADRMVERGHYEELTKLLHFINESPRRIKKRQTYVMSATLTVEVGIPQRLKNKARKTSDDNKLRHLTEKICIGAKPKVIDLTTKDKVAHTLTELRINCATDEKDFYLYYFLCEHPGRTLVFVNSKDCLRRLISLFTLLERSPLPLHADMHQKQRLKNLDRFSADSKALLIASDVAARGLDIPNIDHVIHYQVPRTIENYVHRSGRTARASNIGLTVMLVGAEDAKDYRKIVRDVKNGKEIPILPVDLDLMPAVKTRVQLARSIDVTEHRSKKRKTHNRFFQKAAEDMDIVIDDEKLLLGLGDAVEQSEEKQKLKSMKQQLSALMKRQLTPLHMTKYPTKSGQLVSKKVIDLYQVQV